MASTVTRFKYDRKYFALHRERAVDIAIPAEFSKPKSLQMTYFDLKCLHFFLSHFS